MGSIELIGNCQEVRDILNDPEMLGRICEDGQNIVFDDNTIDSMLANGMLLGWFVDSDLKGFYWVHEFCYSIAQIHAHFPKEKRTYAKHSGKAMLKWLKDNIPSQYKKFMAQIPECYKDVIGFSVREGLRHSGRIEQAAYRNGKCYDIIVLSVNRECI